MSGNVSLWSKTDITNQTIDAAVNFAEGQLPGTVNNSARAVMSGIAAWRDDLNGTLTTSGSANAQTVTTNTAYAALATGIVVAFKAGFTNTAAATLTVTGASAFAAKAIRMPTIVGDAALPANTIVKDGQYIARYSSAGNGGAGAWILVNPTGRNKSASSTVTLYTNYSTGSDTTGTGASGAPFKSVAYAYYYGLNLLDFDGTASTPTRLVIQMADSVTDSDGIHASAHAFIGAQGGAAITIQGGTASVLAFAQVYFGILNFKDLKLQGTSQAYCLDVQYGAFVYLDNVKFGNSPISAAINVGMQSRVDLVAGGGGINIDGINCFSAITNRGVFNTASCTVTINADQTVSGAWLYAEGGLATFGGSTLTNVGPHTITGKRYALVNGATVYSGAGTTTYFPGTVAGTNDGGYYDSVPQTDFEVVNTTYDISTANGNKDVTGFTFTPQSAEISWSINAGSAAGWGHVDKALTQGSRGSCTDVGTIWLAQTTNAFVVFNAAATAGVTGQASFIAGGVRIAMTKTGSPTGTVNMTVTGYR